ncbi:MAG: SpoIIIAC/SpoIIIAD family protein [Oscillospiraceae bacterium]|nr:SpoIIIAC/SpoIIIAD family protein [Oscillospiraceae bacterium]
MELIGKITAICVAAALLALVVKKGTPEIALALSLATVAVGLLALSDTLGELETLFRGLREESGLPEGWFSPLYKTVAIAIVVRIGGDLCRDAGERALAGVVETAGAVCALAAAVPLLRSVLRLILELMK